MTRARWPAVLTPRLVSCTGFLAVALLAGLGHYLAIPAIAQEHGAAPASPDHIRQVKRVCVEDFEGGENARQLRAMLIDQLRRMELVVITENPERADAFLRGFAEDLVFTEQHSRDENVGARSQNAIATGGYTRNRRAISGSAAANEATRDRSTERRHEAALTVRIVSASGDVLWSASAESRGGKYRSAAAEVSQRVAADLKKALESAADAIPGSPADALPRDSANSSVSSGPAPD